MAPPRPLGPSPERPLKHDPKPLTDTQDRLLTEASRRSPLPLFRRLRTEDEILAGLTGHWMFCEPCRAYEHWGLLHDRPTLIVSLSSAMVLQQ